MADTYSIKLRLDVDDSALTRTEQRLRKIDGTTVSRRYGSGYTRPVRGDYPNSLFRRLGADPSGFRAGAGILHNRWERFSAGFLGNILTPRGFLINASNFGRALSSVGTLMGKAFPLIGGAMTALQMGVKTAIGISAYRIGRGAIPVMIGNKLLNNEQLGSAASNLMQMRMAQIGLGGEYAGALKQATGIAAEYGYSRAGIISAINMFRGLDIGGGNRITTAQASQLAKIIGKISHTGNAPYERVSLNLQQLLGQNVPSGRDVRELITAAPLIGKLAQQSMFRTTGSVGNIQEYLKDKGRLLEVLAEFDKRVESNPFLQARGRVAMAKENFFMNIVSGNGANWKKIGEGIERFFNNLAPIATAMISGVAKMTNSVNIDIATQVITKFGKKMLKFMGVSTKYIKMIEGADPDLHVNELAVFDPESGTLVTAPAIKNPLVSSKTYVGNRQKAYIAAENYKTNLFSRKAIEKILGRKLTEDDEPFIEMLQSNPSSFVKEESVRMGRAVLEYPRLKAALTPRYAQDLHQSYDIEFDEQSAKIPFRSQLYTTPQTGTKFVPDVEKVKELFTGTSDNLANLVSGTTDETTDELERLSKGTKALVINFNKEIVSMPINIDSVSDGTDLGARLMNLLRENIVEGLNVALNNATGAI